MDKNDKNSSSGGPKKGLATRAYSSPPEPVTGLVQVFRLPGRCGPPNAAIAALLRANAKGRGAEGVLS